MSLSVGIVGLPNVGKSTIFNTLTKQQTPAENRPFCTIDPCVGVVDVPDERLKKIAEIEKSAKSIYTTVNFVDIAGLIKGASKGEGLGNAFLSHIREVDVIFHLVRGFDKKDVLHTEGSIEPQRDIEIINAELILSDIEVIEKKLKKIEKDVKKGDKDALREKEILSSALEQLNKSNLLSDKEHKEEEKKMLSANGLLTIKPMLYILNISQSTDISKIENSLKEKNIIYIDISFEEGMADLGKEEAEELRKGMVGDSIDVVIRRAYDLLELITFFTAGEKEARAWTTNRNATLPRAGRSIHTDFEEKFIRAEVVSYKDFIESGSIAKARENGKLRIEGKEYIVQDGDIIYFRI